MWWLVLLGRQTIICKLLNIWDKLCMLHSFVSHRVIPIDVGWDLLAWTLYLVRISSFLYIWCDYSYFFCEQSQVSRVHFPFGLAFLCAELQTLSMLICINWDFDIVEPAFVLLVIGAQVECSCFQAPCSPTSSIISMRAYSIHLKKDVYSF